MHSDICSQMTINTRLLCLLWLGKHTIWDMTTEVCEVGLGPALNCFEVIQHLPAELCLGSYNLMSDDQLGRAVARSVHDTTCTS